MLPIQAAMNTRLGKDLSNPVLGALISFLVGTVGLVFYLAVTRASLPSGERLASVPLWAWWGGLLGAAYVSAIIVVTPRIGVAASIGLAIAGQLLLSVLLDNFGWLGLPVHHFNWGRALGVALLIAGVILIKKF